MGALAKLSCFDSYPVQSLHFTLTNICCTRAFDRIDRRNSKEEMIYGTQMKKKAVTNATNQNNGVH